MCHYCTKVNKVRYMKLRGIQEITKQNTKKRNESCILDDRKEEGRTFTHPIVGCSYSKESQEEAPPRRKTRLLVSMSYDSTG